MEKIGMKHLEKFELPEIPLSGIKSLAQYDTFPYKPELNELNVKAETKPEKKKNIVQAYRAEAGIIVNNTVNISEINLEKETQQKKIDPFNLVVNARFEQNSENDFPTIGFSTQEYFNEAYKLSKNPNSYLHEERNPIFKQTHHQNVAKVKERPYTHKTLSMNSQFSNSNCQLSRDIRPSLPKCKIKDTQELDQGIEFLFEGYDKKPQTQHQPFRRQEESIKYWQERQRDIISGQYCREKYSSLNKNKQNKEDKAYTINEPITQLNNDQFFTNFKAENVHTLKLKESKMNIFNLGKFQPPSEHKFRTDEPPKDKIPFKTRLKIERPQTVYQDQRCQEMLLKEYQEHQKLEAQHQDYQVEQRHWVNNFTLPGKLQEIGTGQRFQFIDKDQYKDSADMINELLRKDEQIGGKDFRLYFRPISTTDKNFTFGRKKDSIVQKN